VFPYNLLKGRVEAVIQEQLGRSIEVSIDKIEPYYFTGVSISKLSLSMFSNGGSRSIIELQKVRGRISFFSLIFGSPRVNFFAKSGKGKIEGSMKQTDVGFDIKLKLDNFDISSVKWFSSFVGLDISGFISGDIDLSVDRSRFVKSKGKVNIKFKNLKVNPSNITISDIAIPVPEIIFSKAQNSQLRVEIDRGTATINELKFSEGDLEMNMTGKVFMSSVISNYRLNLSGSFSVSEKLAKDIPYLIMVENQKQQDGSYPLSITGRISSPLIKIGTFTLPF